ncbi:MAG: hypothetical protein QOI98_1560 [Solirubrobacteraceae bacterium]|jgi:hypothetical protein|nr:hypothetical protein [Solirubrobacteraceae bacterium]
MRQGRRAVLTCGLAALAAGSWASSASAGALPNATLSGAGQVVSWHGKSTDPTGQGYGLPTQHACSASTCDSFILKIDLPAGSFPKAPLDPTPPGITRIHTDGATDMPGDGVLISIRWATDFDQWNLYVDDMSTGRTVGEGSAVDSNGQSVLLSRPHNGTYRVTMVPFITNVDKADLEYKGEARVFHDPTQRSSSPRSLLPEIETVAPDNFHMSDIPPVPSNPTGWRFTPPGTFPGNSCYLDETAQYGSTRCLRFDNTIRNVGEGPLILRFSYAPQDFVGQCDMEQEILSTAAKVTERNAGPCVFHVPHGHFHYQNMGTYQLYPVGAGGAPAAHPLVVSKKIGFCTIDVDYFTFGRDAAAQRPRTYSFPACNIPNAYSTSLVPSTPYGPGGIPEYMGISVGWGDIYTWDLPTQYLDVSAVPDGVYEVVSRSNPDSGILTAGRGRETGVTCIHLTGTRVETVMRFPSQANADALPVCGPKPVVAKTKKKAGSRRAKAKHRARCVVRRKHGKRRRVCKPKRHSTRKSAKQTHRARS